MCREYWKYASIIYGFGDCNSYIDWISKCGPNRCIFSKRHKDHSVRNNIAIFRWKLRHRILCRHGLPIDCYAIWHCINNLHWTVPMHDLQYGSTMRWSNCIKFRSNFKTFGNRKEVQRWITSPFPKYFNASSRFWPVSCVIGFRWAIFLIHFSIIRSIQIPYGVFWCIFLENISWPTVAYIWYNIRHICTVDCKI